ncbi:hypothetical protein TCAL_08377 [Tigriopus californicus]|uniref:HMG box domain-containing protein n=1 Tax=Tigriopus californicus TaxID=6832 RepID=A0A553PBY0_TIGCA|nr:hypothetical protein TCAL_08377 [Tigriopus californicus]
MGRMMPKTDNEHLANRIYEIQTLIKKERRKKRLLMMKLDQIGDNYRNVPIIMPPKEVENFQLAMASGGLYGKGDKNASGAPKRKPGRPPKGPVGRPPKKPKEGKDPNLPKRPQNPFFQYCQEQRARVHREYQREQNVELSKKELTKILAQRWHEMGSEQKKIYNLLFEEEKQRYSANISEYQLAKAKESLLKS